MQDVHVVVRLCSLAMFAEREVNERENAVTNEPLEQPLRGLFQNFSEIAQKILRTDGIFLETVLLKEKLRFWNNYIIKNLSTFDKNSIFFILLRKYY